MQLKTKQKQAVIMFLLAIVALIYLRGYISERKRIYILSSYENMETNSDNLNSVEIINPQKQNIKIHIEGAIANPGLYELKVDSRVYDAVKISGGLLEDADRKRINLARKINDEDFIYIPFIDDLGEFAQNEDLRSDDRNGLININTASKKELETLVGIGPALAERIINYRNENGRFNSIEEILNVNGIGEKKFRDISNSITVR